MNGWLIFLGIIFLIAIFPIGICARYDEDGAAARLIVGPVKIPLYPRPKKSEKKKDQTEAKPGKKAAPAQKSPDGPPEGAPSKKLSRPKKGGDITDFLPLVDVALDMLSGLTGRLRVNFLQLRLTMAGDDPCDLAVNYGRAQAAGAALLAQLHRFLVIKKQDVQIQCDFMSEKTTIQARLDLTITIGRAVSLAAVYGVRALKTYFKIKKHREGGAAL